MKQWSLIKDNVYSFPIEVTARDVVDDMLAAYCMYINNLHCKDSDVYWERFIKARDMCKKLKEEDR